MSHAESDWSGLWQGKIETELTSSEAAPHSCTSTYVGFEPMGRFSPPWPAATRSMPPASRHDARDPNAVHEIDDWLDLLVCYGSCSTVWGWRIRRLPHSFGGMVACEFAAANPGAGATAGLDFLSAYVANDAPVRNWLIIPEAERRQALFAAPDGEAARAFLRGS